MMKMKLTLFVWLCSVTILSHAQVSNESSGKKKSAGEKVNLSQMLPDSMQSAMSLNNSKIIEGCLNLLSNPISKLTFRKGAKTEVLKSGLPFEPDLQERMSEISGKLIACSFALSESAVIASPKLIAQRPERHKAISIIAEVLSKHMDASYTNFQLQNQHLFSNPTFIAQGNGGFSQEYQEYNDLYGQGVMNLKGQGNQVQMIQDGGVNDSRKAGGTVREVIFDKVASFYTRPTMTNEPCSKGLCKANYSLIFDNGALSIKRNGQRFFDDEYVGGASYSIDISGDRSSGTSFKVSP